MNANGTASTTIDARCQGACEFPCGGTCGYPEKHDGKCHCLPGQLVSEALVMSDAPGVLPALSREDVLAACEESKALVASYVTTRPRVISGQSKETWACAKHVPSQAAHFACDTGRGHANNCQHSKWGGKILFDGPCPCTRCHDR